MTPGQRRVIEATVLAFVVAALYAPFIRNPLVFDDHGFFTGLDFARQALSPFGAWTRAPQRFSIALVEVIWGRIEAHRVVSLALHVACSVCVYVFINALRRAAALRGDPDRRHWPALFGAALFALHPAAVYAAGYLAQRATVLATLFLLLSLATFVLGVQRRRYPYAFLAAALYALAVLSKEHALPGAALGIALLVLVDAEPRFRLRYAALYLVACLPAAIFVLGLVKGVIGQPYEPHFAAVASQVAHGAALPGSPWLVSAAAQAALFWAYLTLWLWPRTGAMSIDLRVDFTALWSLSIVATLAFLAFGALAVMLLLRRGRVGVAGFGLLYVWLLFLVEFTSVRFQEPFVLYRSYLWAPGLAIAATAVLASLPWRILAGAAVPALLVLGWQAHDRLETFSSGVALWEDAAAKLPPKAIPGGYRPLYELGREYSAAGRPAEAAVVVDHCTALYPDSADCLLARAALYMQGGEDERALSYLRRAIALQGEASRGALLLGIVLENLGCFDEARAQYLRLVSRGRGAAQYYIDRLDSPGKGVLPPRAVWPPERSHAECAKLG